MSRLARALGVVLLAAATGGVGYALPDDWSSRRLDGELVLLFAALYALLCLVMLRRTVAWTALGVGLWLSSAGWALVFVRAWAARDGRDVLGGTSWLWAARLLLLVGGATMLLEMLRREGTALLGCLRRTRDGPPG